MNAQMIIIKIISMSNKNAQVNANTVRKYETIFLGHFFTMVHNAFINSAITPALIP